MGPVLKYLLADIITCFKVAYRALETLCIWSPCSYKEPKHYEYLLKFKINL